MPLSQMIRRIIRKSEMKEIQVPSVKNGLTKEIYFVPKNVSVFKFILFKMILVTRKAILWENPNFLFIIHFIKVS